MMVRTEYFALSNFGIDLILNLRKVLFANESRAQCDVSQLLIIESDEILWKPYEIISET